jgi:hypothetical protein
MTKPEPFDPARLRELLGRISPGPWNKPSPNAVVTEDGRTIAMAFPNPKIDDGSGPANAAFIAYCGTHASDIAAMAEEVAKLRGLIVQQADHSKAREVTVWNRAIKSCLAMMKPCNRLDHAEAAIRALKRPTT